ncbi:hypothetical protein VTO73DRAFT_8872 [Trametes versicolor]
MTFQGLIKHLCFILRSGLAMFFINGTSRLLGVLYKLTRLGHQYDLSDIVDDGARYLENFSLPTTGPGPHGVNAGTVDAAFDFTEAADTFEADNLARLL